MKVYIVQGRCGDYEVREWLVKAFLSKRKAEEWRELCQKKTDELAEWFTNESNKIYDDDSKTIALYNKFKKKAAKAMKDLDPNYETEFGVTNYFVSDIELDNSIDSEESK
jgi:16S rRNA C967 or C1407 C5-methylase (RsmB/RsmF family)